MIKNIFLFLIIVALCLSLSIFLALTEATETPKVGDELPLIKLPVPKSLEDRKYLGLRNEDSFSIPEIEADVVIIYIFSYYCHFCAMQVPYVRELYGIIDKNPRLKKKIKFIGIGIGSTYQNVDVYRKTHNLSFPLFADADFTIYRAYGEITCPHFIIVKIKPNGTHKVICYKYAFRYAHAFLKLILKKSGIPNKIVDDLNEEIL